MDAFEAADDGDHRQRRFDMHALIPGAFGTPFAVVGNALGTAQAIVGQDNALPVHAPVSAGGSVDRGHSWCPNPRPPPGPAH